MAGKARLGYLSIAFWNIDGVVYVLNNKRFSKLDVPEVIDNITKHEIICLAETHCGYDANISLEGYSTVNNVRPKSPKAKKFSGGLAFLVKDNIKNGISFIPASDSEMMWLRLYVNLFST